MHSICRFSHKRIGSNAHDACKTINPHSKLFKDAKYLKEEHTNLLNRHARLRNRTNASGTGPAIDISERLGEVETKRSEDEGHCNILRLRYF